MGRPHVVGDLVLEGAVAVGQQHRDVAGARDRVAAGIEVARVGDGEVGVAVPVEVP
jgi:hypothetical protein